MNQLSVVYDGLRDRVTMFVLIFEDVKLRNNKSTAN